MAVAHAEMETAARRCPYSGPEVVQIETHPERIVCSKCGVSQVDGCFWGMPGGTGRTWRRTKWCMSCRHSERNRRYVDPSRTELRLLARERNRVGTESRFYDTDPYRQRRCNVCRGTLYRQVVLVHARGYPAAYIVEWVCWSGGHLMLERWRVGSPVRGRFPTSETVLSSSPPESSRPKPLPIVVRYDPRQVRDQVSIAATGSVRMNRGASMKIVDDGMAILPGCDMRCEILRYRDADDPSSPIRMRRMHSAEAHNEHEPSRLDHLTAFSWGGLEVNFTDRTMVLDGVRISDVRKTQLTPIEWKILEALVRNFGKMLTHDQMILSVWGEACRGQYHLLRVNMTRLRKKLAGGEQAYKGVRGHGDRFITTVPGMGYRMGDASVTQMAPTGFELSVQNGHAAVLV